MFHTLEKHQEGPGMNSICSAKMSDNFEDNILNRVIFNINLRWNCYTKMQKQMLDNTSI